METIHKITSSKGNSEELESFLFGGLKEKEKRIKFAITRTQNKINKLENKFNKKTSNFLEEFKQGLIEENPDTFDWWAETKLLKELEVALETLEAIKICQE